MTTLVAAPAMTVLVLVALGSPAALAAQSHQHGPAAPAAIPPDRTAHGPDRASQAPGPDVLENLSREPGVVEVRLVAAPARMLLLPGSDGTGDSTDVFAYNGRMPGPLLEAREGDRVIVHFRNELPEPTTVHWHGLHLPFTADGSPFHLVAPGEAYTYEFTIHPGTAGTYWYHPHPHHRTGYQVGMGLYGGIVIRAADDPLAHLPEQLLILADNRFREDRSLDFPDPSSPAGRADFENGREGDVVFVNGVVTPTLEVAAGAVQRWRVINASAARVYRLALEGHTLLHVGSDGGLFEHPVAVDEVLVANGERVELLVRPSGAEGGILRLHALPYDRYIPQTRPVDWNTTREVLRLRLVAGAGRADVDEGPGSEAQDRAFPGVPDTLRRVPALDTTAVSVRRVMTMSQGFINGRAMDMARVDAVAELGATEIWEVENVVGMDHPFHLHGFQFQVLDRDGVPEAQRAWKDTVNVPGRSSVRFIVRFDRYAGLWMFHCHILSHEDAGMMGVLQVREGGLRP